MAKKIQGKDFFDASVNKSIDSIIEKLKALDGEYAKMAKDLEKNRATLKGNTAEEKKLREAYQQKNALLKEANRISKAQAAADAKLATVGSKQNRQLLEAKEALRAKNAQIKQSIALGGRDAQAVNMQNSSLRQLEKALAMNRAAFANMSAAQRNNQKVGGRLNATIQRQAQEVDKLRTSMGQAQQRVGGYREAFQKVQMRMMAVIGVVMGVSRAIKGSLQAFYTQEKAVAQAQIVFGKYASEVQKAASEVQDMTTVGDEQFIKLAVQAKNMGIAQQEVNDITKGAIGLATKFEAVGLSQETALKGIATALEGDFNQLKRYIPALRSATTEAESMAILQREMADGFDLAVKSTNTAYGASEQYANLMGDIRELIGEKIAGNGGALSKLNKVLKWIIANFDRLVIIVKATITFFIAYRVALNASAIATGKLDKATKLFGKTLNWLKKLNPYALIAAGIVAAGVAIAALTRNTNKYAKAAEAAAASAENEKRKMNELFDELKKVNPESERAADLRELLNARYRDYLPNLLTEKTSLDEIKKSQKAANDELVRTILLKAKDKTITEELDKVYEKLPGKTKELTDALVDEFGMSATEANEVVRKFIAEERKIIADAQDDATLMGLQGADLLKEIAIQTALADDTLTDVQRKMVENTRNIGNAYTELNSEIAPIQNILNAESEVVKDVNDVWDALIPTLKKATKVTEDNTDSTDDNTDALKRNAAVLKEMPTLYDDLRDAVADYLNTESDLTDEQALVKFLQDAKKAKEDADKVFGEDAFDNYTPRSTETDDTNPFGDSSWQEEALEFWDKYGQEGMDAVNSIGDAFRAFSERRQAEHELELHNVQEDYDARIAAAGGDAALVEQLQDQKLAKEKEIQAKILEEKQKQAKIDKALALFNAAITGAIKIIEVSGNPILLALTSAAVAAQIAAIALTPIPQFYKGTKSAPGGAAMVGERGVEAMFTPDGKISLTPDHATVMDIPKGTEILTHEQTNRFIAGAISDRQAENRIAEKDYTRYFKKLVKNTAKQDKTIIQSGNSEYRKRYVN